MTVKTSSTLPDKYLHKTVEASWHERWEKQGIYRWNKKASREESFVIDTPPPTVSGLLHMGHIFSYTQADFIARYQRMKGKTVFYPMGFDDNGLPTERLVEKVKKVRGSDMPREAFNNLCQEVVQEAEEEFRRLFRSVALSVDWSEEYQTVSTTSRKISQLSFLDLYQKDKAYRKLQPCLWDPTHRTALAQADIEDKEMQSRMHEVAFTTENGERIVIATTRPELIPACVAVLFHPEDSRYQHLKGQSAITALFGIKVSLLADETVEKEKGTGLVMCCTFGDITDITWWQKHQLPLRIVLDKAGRLSGLERIYNGEWPSIYKSTVTTAITEKLTGLKVKEARTTILAILEENNLLLKSTDITHTVKCAERSGTPLEILVTPQWFIRILEEKSALLKRSAECNWYPAHMKIRLDQWIEGLSWDWCISRQRFFGVPFPLWYSKRKGEEGKILVATPDQLPVDPLVDLPQGYNKEEVEPEHDVMDTWATSSVSPQLNSQGITDSLSVDSARHHKLFPADLRPQAHEIIRTWAFYTIVKAHYHEHTIPWKNLMISGWCLAPDKSKMSKSKGNVITPVDLIEDKGADVVRYWASTSRLGTDTAFSEDVLKIGHKLVNKVWNATKFAAIHLSKLTHKPGTAIEDVSSGIIYETPDLWILTRLRKTIEKATREFERFEYCNARVAAEEFFWNDFCDNYLEIVKVRAYAEQESISPKAQQSAITTLYHCLDGILRLFAPFLPHITEELYSHIFPEQWQGFGNSIHARGTWLDANAYPLNENAEKSGISCVAVLNAVRKIKAENNVSLKWPIELLAIENASSQDQLNFLAPMLQDLKHVTNTVEIKTGTLPDICTLVQPTEDGLFKVAACLGKKEA